MTTRIKLLVIVSLILLLALMPSAYATVSKLPIHLAESTYGANSDSRFLIPEYEIYLGDESVSGTGKTAAEIAEMYKPSFVKIAETSFPDEVRYRVIRGYDPYALLDDAILIQYFSYFEEQNAFISHCNDYEPVFVWVKTIGERPYKVSYDSYTDSRNHFNAVLINFTEDSSWGEYYELKNFWTTTEIEDVYTQSAAYYPQGRYKFNNNIRWIDLPAQVDIHNASDYVSNFDGTNIKLKIARKYNTYDLDLVGNDGLLYEDYALQQLDDETLTDWYTSKVSPSCTLSQTVYFPYDVSDPFQGLFWEIGGTNKNFIEPDLTKVILTTIEETDTNLVINARITYTNIFYASGHLAPPDQPLAGLRGNRFELFIDDESLGVPVYLNELNPGNYSLQFNKGNYRTGDSVRLSVKDNVDQEKSTTFETPALGKTTAGKLPRSGMWEAKFHVSTTHSELKFRVDSVFPDTMDLSYISPSGIVDSLSDASHGSVLRENDALHANAENGVWTIRLEHKSGPSVMDEVEFSLTVTAYTPPNPEEPVVINPPGGVNFTRIDTSYISTCDGSGDIKFVVRGVPAAPGEPVVDASEEAERFAKYFRAGLVIPNYKQWVSLPLGNVALAAPFEQTEAARVMLEADLKMKSADANVMADAIGNLYGWYEPRTDWWFRTEFVPGSMTMNSNGCEIYIEDSQFDITTELMQPRDNSQFAEAFREKLQNHHRPAVLDVVNSDPYYDELRRVYEAFALAQWYKTLDRDKTPLGHLIDSENLTGAEADTSFDPEYWTQQSQRKLYGVTGWPGYHVRGGVTFRDLTFAETGSWSPELNDLLRETRTSGYIEKDGVYYMAGSIPTSGPDLTVAGLWFSDVTPATDQEVTVHVLVKNSGTQPSEAFDVSFHTRYTNAEASTSLQTIGSTRVNALQPREFSEVTITWDTKSLIGNHEIYAAANPALSVWETTHQNNMFQEEITVYSRVPTAIIQSPAPGSISYSGSSIQFSGYGDDAQDGAIYDTLEWRLEDGSVLGTESTITVTDLSEGVHTITLTVTDSTGLKDTAQVTVVVNSPQYPSAQFFTPFENEVYAEGETIYFEGVGADLEDGVLSSAALQWHSSLDGAIGSGTSFSHKSLSVGTHDITLTVTDSGAYTSSITRTITINEGMPSVFILPFNPSELIEGRAEIFNTHTITFEGYAIDPQDISFQEKQLSWASSVDGFLGSGSKLQLNNLSAGTHDITLTAVDTHGLVAIANTTLLVHPPFKPLVSILRPLFNQDVTHGDPVFFEGSARDPEDGSLDGSSFTWNSSLDGFLGTGIRFNTSELSVGDHVLTVFVQDSSNLTSMGNTQLTIRSRPPVVAITEPSERSVFKQNRVITLNGHAEDLEDGTLSSSALSWSSNVDGVLGTGSPLQVSSLSAGTHTVTLTATDSAGFSSNESINLLIASPQTALLNRFTTGQQNVRAEFPVGGGSTTSFIELPASADVSLAQLDVTGACHGACPASTFAEPFDTLDRLDLTQTTAYFNEGKATLYDRTYTFDSEGDLDAAFESRLGSAITQLDNMVALTGSDAKQIISFTSSGKKIFRYKVKLTNAGPIDGFIHTYFGLTPSENGVVQGDMDIMAQTDGYWYVRYHVRNTNQYYQWYSGNWVNENIRTNIPWYNDRWYTVEYEDDGSGYTAKIYDGSSLILSTSHLPYTQLGPEANVNIRTSSEVELYLDDVYTGYDSTASIMSTTISASGVVKKATLTESPAIPAAINSALDAPAILAETSTNSVENLIFPTNLPNAEAPLENETVTVAVLSENQTRATSEIQLASAGVSYTSLNYFLSADNGAHWTACTPDVECTFEYPGTELKWMAALSTTSNQETPSIEELALTYRGGDPNNPILDVNTDSTNEWSYAGFFTETQTLPDFSSATQANLNACTTESCMISITTRSDALGALLLDNVNVQFTYADILPPLLNWVEFDSPVREGTLLELRANASDNYLVTRIDTTLDGVTTTLTPPISPAFTLETFSDEQPTFTRMLSPNENALLYLSLPQNATIQTAQLALDYAADPLEWTPFVVDMQAFDYCTGGSICNGMDRLFDNNENLYFSQVCQDCTPVSYGYFSVPADAVKMKHQIQMWVRESGCGLAVSLYNYNTVAWDEQANFWTDMRGTGQDATPVWETPEILLANYRAADGRVYVRYAATIRGGGGTGCFYGIDSSSTGWHRSSYALYSVYATLDVGNDGMFEVDSTQSELSLAQVPGFSEALTRYIQDECTTSVCEIPLRVSNARPGAFTLFNLSVEYTEPAPDVFETTRIVPPPGKYMIQFLVWDEFNLSTPALLELVSATSGQELILVENEVQFTPVFVSEGETLVIEIPVYNFGEATVTTPVSFYVDDELVDTQELTIPAIHSTTVTFSWLAVSDEHTLRIQADPENAISEFNESNNAVSFTVTGADRTPPEIQDLKIQLPLSVPVQATTSGISTLSASGISTLSISTRVTDEVGVLSVSAQIGSTNIPLSLSAGTSTGGYSTGDSSDETITSMEVTGSTTLDLPTGTYMLRVTVVDVDGLTTTKEVGFEVEGNDVDLRMEPGSIFFENNTLYASVRNRGATPLENVPVEFIINNEIVDTQTVLMSAKTTEQFSVEWTPAPGAYAVTIRADPENIISEILEDNNERTVVLHAVDVRAPIITSIQLDSDEPNEGVPFNVHVQVDDESMIAAVTSQFDDAVQSLTLFENTFSGVLTAFTKGTHTLTIRATDVNGLETERSIIVPVYSDAVDLSVNSIQFSEGLLAGSNTTLEAVLHNYGAADATDAVIHLLVDGVLLSTETITIPAQSTTVQSIVWPSPEVGDQDITLRVQHASDADLSNNELTQSILVPSSGPDAPELTVPNDWSASPEVEASWSTGFFSPLDVFEYRMDESVWIPTTKEKITFLLADGVHLFEVRAIDSQSNLGAAASGLLRVDVTAPDAPRARETQLGTRWTSSQDALFVWDEPMDSGSGIAQYEAEVGAISQTLGNVNMLPQHFDSGVHTFRVRAIDRVGHKSEWSNTLTVYIDTAAPSITSLTSSTHELGIRSKNTTPQFSWEATDEHTDIAGYYYAIDTSPDTIPDERDFYTSSANVELNSIGISPQAFEVGSPDIGLPDGTWYFHVASLDAVGNLEPRAEHFELNIQRNRAPVIELLDDITIFEGETVAPTVVATDPDGDLVATTLNGPLALGSWTTTFDDSGVYIINVTASDGELSTTQSFTLTVLNVNRAPTLLPLDDVTITETETVSILTVSTDPDNSNTVTNDDTTLTVTISNPIGDDGTWETTVGDAGTYTIEVAVSDGEFTDSKSFTLTVLSSNQAPIITGDNLGSSGDSIIINELDTRTFSITATDPDGDVLTYSWLLDGVEVSTESVWDYVTPSDDVGLHEVMVVVSDGVDQVERSWTVTVNEVIVPPVVDYYESVNDPSIYNSPGGWTAPTGLLSQYGLSVPAGTPLIISYNYKANAQSFTRDSYIRVTIFGEEGIVDSLSFRTPTARWSPERHVFMITPTVDNPVIQFNYVNGDWGVGIRDIRIMREPLAIDSVTPSIDNVDALSGGSYNFSVSVTGSIIGSLSYSWLLDDVEVSTAELYTYAPLSADVGLHSLEVRVSSSESVVTHAWSVTVSEEEVVNPVHVNDVTAYSSSGQYGSPPGTLVEYTLNSMGEGLLEIQYDYSYFARSSGRNAYIRTYVDNVLVDTFAFKGPRGSWSSSPHVFVTPANSAVPVVRFVYVNGDWRLGMRNVQITELTPGSIAEPALDELVTIWAYAKGVHCSNTAKSHYLEVNGDSSHRVTFNPCVAFGDSFNWVSFEIPVGWLNPGVVNSFKFRDYNSGWNDHDLVLGIDTSTDLDQSQITTDGNSLSGEAMIYLQKVDNTTVRSDDNVMDSTVWLNYKDDHAIKLLMYE